MTVMENVENISYQLGELSGKAFGVSESISSALRLDKLATNTYEKALKRNLKEDKTMASITLLATAGPVTNMVADKLSEFAAKVSGGDKVTIKDAGTKVAKKYVEGFQNTRALKDKEQ